MKKNRAYTFIEMMLVVALFSFIFSIVLSIIFYSNRSFRIGRTEQRLQQEARKALDYISLDLRESSPRWITNNGNYEISINAGGDLLSFYLPVTDAFGAITSLREVRYYVAGKNNKQLFREIANLGADAITDDVIDNVPEQKPFFQFANADFTQVIIKIPIIINQESFVLNSNVSLRNNQTVIGAVPVEEVPQEGEF